MSSEYKPPPNISPLKVLTNLYKPRDYIRDFAVFWSDTILIILIFLLRLPFFAWYWKMSNMVKKKNFQLTRLKARCFTLPAFASTYNRTLLWLIMCTFSVLHQAEKYSTKPYAISKTPPSVRMKRGDWLSSTINMLQLRNNN